MCLIREFLSLIIRLYLEAGPTTAAQFYGTIQYLLTLCLYLLTVDVLRAVRVCLAIGNYTLSQCYMPYENNSVSTEEFAQLLSVFDDLIITYSDYNFVIGGDFNVYSSDSSRNWVHTLLLDSFCDSRLSV